MYKKLAITAVMLIMTVGLAAGAAQAQIAAIYYNGTQSAEGTTDPVSGFIYGNSFVLSSTGEWDSRYLNISINYRNMFQGIGITGGAWSLAVFSDGSYLGTIYGEVVSGDVQFVENGSGKLVSKQTRMTLQSTGGTGIFARYKEQNISGSFNMTTDLRTSDTAGIATLNY
jgi:hypothetical protein